MSDYNPSDHTVQEVVDYVADHPEEADAIRAAEEADKNRSTLLSQLQGQTAEGEVEGQATTSMTKDHLGRALVTPATNGKDFLGRLIVAGDKDYLGRGLVA